MASSGRLCATCAIRPDGCKAGSAEASSAGLRAIAAATCASARCPPACRWRPGPSGCTRWSGNLAVLACRSSTHLVMGVDGLVARSQLQRAGSLTVPAREGDAGVFGQPPGDDVNADDWRATAVTVAPFASAELDLGRLNGSAGVRLEALGLEVSRMTPRVGATPGVGARRLDWAADPRVALSYGPLPWLRLMASGGRYHQLPVTRGS